MPLDTSETQQFVDALVSFSNRTHKAAEAVLEKGVLEAKKNLQAEARKSTHFGQIAPSISYDQTRSANTTEIELGPDKERTTKAGRPGPLANIAYFGGANGGGATLDFDEPVERELDVIDKYMKKLGDDL